MHSPAPLSTAPPAASGRANASPPGSSTRHAGPRDAAPVRRIRLVAPHRRVPQTHARHVEHRVGGPGGQRPDPDSQVSSARHAAHPAVPRHADDWPIVTGLRRCRSCWSPTTSSLHEPRAEIWVGVAHPRAPSCRPALSRSATALVAAGASVERRPPAHDDDPARAVHDPALLTTCGPCTPSGRRRATATWPGRTGSCRTSSRPTACSDGLPVRRPAAIHARAGRSATTR